MSYCISKNPVQFRQNLRKKMQEIFEMTEKDATNLEIGAYNYTLQEASLRKIVKKWENQSFVHIYTDRMRTLYMNLQNIDCIEKIKSGEVLPQQLAFMNHQEMNPKRWEVLIANKMKRDTCRNQGDIHASTDMFVCRKCKSNKCVYYELQTRSADEPSTLFITCVTCGKNWKQ